MTEAESRAVLSWISAHQGSLPANARDADSLVKSYLRAKGLREDRYGNFLNPEDAGMRFHLKERVVNLQEKRGGEWRNIRSMNLIPYAVGLAKKAAELAGDSVVAEKADKKHTAIRAAKNKRAKQASEQVTKRTIWLYAMRRIAFEYPDLFRTNAARVRALSPEQVTELQTKRDEYQAHAEKLIADGHLDWVQNDPFATADRPPLTPFFYEKTAVSWVETIDGVKYRIVVKNEDRMRVTVEIGTHDGFRIDPLRFAVVGLSDSNVEGDGGLSGTATMDRDTAEIAAALVLIDTQTKRSGAGSRMLRLWCKIMRGWRVNRWVVVGAGEEGLPFFEAMDRKGVARIIAPGEEERRKLGALGGVSLVMQCPAERLPNPVYRAIDMVDGRKKNPVDLSGHMHDEHEKYGWWNSARQANPVEQDAVIDTSSTDAMRETLTQILDDDVAAFEAGDRPDYHGVWPVILDANVARPPQDADDDARFAFHDAIRTQIAIASPESLKLYCAYWQACLQCVPGAPEPNPQHYVSRN